METTGTATFDLDMLETIEEAFERCGSEARQGYDFRTARRSLNLLLADWANRGINLWTVDSGTIPLVAGTATYNIPADTVDLLEHVTRINNGVAATQNDIPLERVSFPVYSSIPNKLSQAVRPYQILITRGVAQPTVTLWPVPSDATVILVYWRLRRMQDAGDGINTHDIPFRLLPALTSGLAYYLSLKIPGAQNRTEMLKSIYDEDFQRAAEEDRDRATLRIVPRIGR